MYSLWTLQVYGRGEWLIFMTDEPRSILVPKSALSPFVMDRSQTQDESFGDGCTSVAFVGYRVAYYIINNVGLTKTIYVGCINMYVVLIFQNGVIPINVLLMY